MLRVSKRLTKFVQVFNLNQRSISKTYPIYVADQTEQHASQSPPPNEPKGSGWFKKILGLSIFGVAGLVGYSWYDNEFKHLLEENIPYSKESFDYIFKYLPDSKELLKKLSFSKEEIKPIVQQIEKETEKTAIEEKPKTKSELDVERKHKEKHEAERILKDREDKELHTNNVLEKKLKTLLENATSNVDTAVSSQILAAEAVTNHTHKLREAMETTLEKGEKWENAIGAHNSRSDAIWTAEATKEKAKSSLEKLKAIISEAKADKITKKNKVLLDIEEAVNKLNYSLNTSTAQLSKAQSEARVFTDYQDLVKKGKDQFKKELESILPDVKLSKSSTMTTDELNSLIAHAHRRIDQLQRQLAEQQAMEALRIDSSLEKQKEEDSKLTLEAVNRENERWKAELDILKGKWDLEARVNFEIELRNQLKRQAGAHSDHLIEVLNVQQRELEAKSQVMLNDHISAEKRDFQKQVAGWVARLRGIEEAIDNRAEKEVEGRKAQKLWLACESLQSLISSGRPGATYVEDRLKPLNQEIESIKDSATGNPMILTIISAIPNKALERGVWTENDLTDRFEKVEKVCRRVALIDEDGGSLFKYFLSYLQAAFTIKTGHIYAKSDEIYESDMDAFVILDNAKASLERGDFIQAVRFMNLLKGEAQKVARDWLEEARLTMETKQVAEALLALASATGFASVS